MPAFSKPSGVPCASSSVIQGCGKCSPSSNSLIRSTVRRWVGSGASSSGWLVGSPQPPLRAQIQHAAVKLVFSAMD